MPPIPTYQDAPLHPEGVTPKTAAANSQSGPLPASNPEPTRTVPQAIDNAGPPAPQPGARPMPGPAPTSSGQPPPPIPGANPNYVPQSVTATITSTTTSSVPPPPQLGMTPPAHNTTPTRSTQSIPPPSASGQRTTINFGPVSSPSANEPATDNVRHSLEHPPGYQQNIYAQDGSAADRARLQAAAAEDEDDSLLGTLKSAANEAGKFAQKMEKDAWEWIEKKR